MTRFVRFALLLLVGCAQSKTPVDDDFTSFAGQDEKADVFSSHMRIVGSLDFGQQSSTVRYTSSPRYRAFKFAAQPGDRVDVTVHSTHGDAVAWVLDNNFAIVAMNDDADSTTTDAHVVATLPALPASASATHYIVFRDYYLESHNYTVTLAGGATWDACQTDADCVALPSGGCCPDGSLTAVDAADTDAFDAATACTAVPRPLCPTHVIDDTRVAQCDFATNRCQMIAPEDIHCGGNIATVHGCPDGYACQLAVSRPDTGGSCVAQP